MARGALGHRCRQVSPGAGAKIRESPCCCGRKSQELDVGASVCHPDVGLEMRPVTEQHQMFSLLILRVRADKKFHLFHALSDVKFVNEK